MGKDTNKQVHLKPMPGTVRPISEHHHKAPHPLARKSQWDSAQPPVIVINGRQHLDAGDDNPTGHPDTQRANAGSRDTNNTPLAPRTNANPGAHWFGVYEDDSNEDEDDDQPDMDTANTPAQDRTEGTPTTVPTPNSVPRYPPRN